MTARAATRPATGRTELLIRGWSVLTSAGAGAGALAGRLREPAPAEGVEVTGLYDEPLPAPTGHALPGFDVHQQLGRKGTSAYDRATALAVVAARDALRDAGMDTGGDRRRVGVVLGTSLGSFKSTSDYSYETLVHERPYLVNPLLFPNTVMNCAAGQVAIRLGLRGVNATIAGGALAFLNTVRYAANVIERGYADVMLTGAVEEFSPHRAWAARLSGRADAVPVGEAAAVFVLTGGDPHAGGRHEGGRNEGAAGSRSRIRAVATGYGPGGDPEGRALTGCVERALRQADIDPHTVRTVFTCEAADADRGEYEPAARALGHRPVRVMAKRYVGECDAASSAVTLAVALAEGTRGPVLLTARGPDGAVGAAIVEGKADVGADRG